MSERSWSILYVFSYVDSSSYVGLGLTQLHRIICMYVAQYALVYSVLCYLGASCI
jgi:hypothetical protein